MPPLAHSFDEEQGTPGPGAYDSPRTLGKDTHCSIQKAPNVSFGVKVENARQFLGPLHEKEDCGVDSPGPAAYSPRVKDGNAKYSFGVAARTPASGTHFISKTHAKENMGLWGPGHVYTPKDISPSLCTKIGPPPQTTPRDRSEGPGPAAHTPRGRIGDPMDPRLPDSPRHSFGRSQTERFRDTRYLGPAHVSDNLCKATPGPNMAPNRETGFSLKGGNRFASEERFTPRTQIGSGRENDPGPADYEHRVFISKEAEKFSFPKDKRLKKGVKAGPGPGQYTPRKGIEAEAPKKDMKFAKAERFDGDGTKSGQVDVPGPGMYNPRDVRAPETSRSILGNVPRGLMDPLERSKLLPGPGHYTPREGSVKAVGSDAPKFSFGGKGSARNSTAVLISKEHSRVSAMQDTPGPGAYNVSSTPSGGVKKKSKAGTSSGSRAERFNNHTFIGRLHAQENMSVGMPGPGEYEPRGTHGGAGTGGGTKFGGSDRPAPKARNVPGPGAYTPRGSFGSNGLKFKFGTSQRTSFAKVKF
eukprot:Rmarinus@m.8583